MGKNTLMNICFNNKVVLEMCDFGEKKVVCFNNALKIQPTRVLPAPPPPARLVAADLAHGQPSSQL